MSKNLEIEMRFDGINTKTFRKKLKDVGAKLISKKQIMPLTAYKHPHNKKDIYIRIRDEGNQKTMTVKTNLKDKYPIEREIEINSIEEGHAILNLLGCKVRYHVEKMRETWNLPGCKEIVIDSYPGLPEYIEIDCHSERSLFAVAKKLGITIPKNHKNPMVDDMYYNLYGIPKERKFSKELTFKNGLKVFEGYIKKNKKKFISILKQQQKYIKN